MVLKFCANLSFMFTEKTDNLLERYQLASQAGFKAVEFMFPYKYNIDDVVKVKLCSINISFFCLIIWKISYVSFKAKSAANVDQILINAYPGKNR